MQTLRRPSCRSRSAASLRLSVILVGVVSLCAAAAEALEELPLDTEIVSATVYRHQAQIVREGRVELEPGTVRIVCDDIPEQFIETSLNVEGSGITGAQIVGIDLRRLEAGAAESPRYKGLSKELDELEAEYAEFQIKHRALQRRKDLTGSIGKLSTERAREELAGGSFSTQDWSGLLDFFETEDIETDRRFRGINTESEDLQNRISWIKSELYAMQEGTRRRREVVVDCEVTAPGTMTVEITYLVPGAGWRPEYTVRYIERDGEVDFTYGARIGQATGEDWNAVSVVLSTATPHVGAAPPVLSPQYLGSTTGNVVGRVTDADTGKPLAWANVSIQGTRFGTTTNSDGAFGIGDVPSGTYTFRANFMGYESGQRTNVTISASRIQRVDFALVPATFSAEETIVEASRPIATQPGVVLHEDEPQLSGLWDSSETAKVRPVEPPVVPQLEAQATDSGFAANLVIPKPVDLETGAEPRRSLVVRQRLPGEFVLHAVPRLSDRVFLKGTLQNSLGIPLLSGTAEVYVETAPGGGAAKVSNFVGQEGLTSVAPGEEFTLHLGVDQNVKVEYELRKKETLSKSTDKTTKVRYEYSIVVESFKQKPAEVRVTDRIPVSTMKEIEIDDLEITPVPDELEEDGLATWKVVLEPGQKSELTVEYVLKYPRGLEPRDFGFNE